MTITAETFVNINRSVLWEEFEYEPHMGQKVYHASKARFRVAASGRRFGKSQMSMMDGAPDLFIPKSRWWVVADTYFTGEEEFNYIEEAILKLVRRYKLKLNRHLHNVKQGDLLIELAEPFSSSVSVRSAMHPKSLVGKGLKRVTFAEAAKLDPEVFEKHVGPALADYRGKADFTSTPEGDNWFKQIYDRGQPTLDGGPNTTHRIEQGAPWENSYESWNFPAWLNDKVYPGGFDDPEIQRQMGTPNGTAIFWQEIGARFDALSGLVYPDFTEAANVRDHHYNPAWPNYEFFDFAYSPHYWVCLDVQVGPCRHNFSECGGDWYIWREYYETGKTVLRHIEELKARMDPGGFAIAAGFGDAASPGDIEELGRNWCQMYADPEAKGDFGLGVAEVAKRVLGRDGNPHVYVAPRCPNTIRQFKNYKWGNKGATLSKPPNQDDDGMDAVRYGAMHFRLYNIGVDLGKFYEESVTREAEYERREGEPATLFRVPEEPMFTLSMGPF